MSLIREMLRVICQVFERLWSFEKGPLGLLGLLTAILGDLWRNRIHCSVFQDYSALIMGFTKKRRQCLSCSCSFFRECFTHQCEHHHAPLGSCENAKSGPYMSLVGIVVLRHAPFRCYRCCLLLEAPQQTDFGSEDLEAAEMQLNHNISQTISSFHTFDL